MWMLSEYEYNSGLSRYYGLPVRPVYGDGSAQAEVKNISLDETEINLLVGETRQLTATIDPVAVTEPLLEWGTDQYTIATVSDSGVVTAVAPGSTTITVITFDGGKTAVCKVNVSKTVPIPNAVDLGLTSGLLWADTNMGATSPEDAGNFYAWAETGTKENYGWETYKWCMGTEKTLTKYVANPEYGYNGMRDTFELVYEHEDDVVCEEFGYNYGQGWRLPSVSAWEELREECDWEWTTRNGKEGFLVSSKTNSNSIFLPAAGIKAGTTSIDKGGYWTSEYDKYYSSEAYCLHLVEERIEDEQAHITHIYRTYNVESLPRCYGMNVRPVF